MSDVRDRNLLYARLEEVLGAEPAGILMRQLPPNDEILTKTDLREFGATVETRMGGIEIRIDGLEHRMDGLEHRMDGLEHRMERLETHMERFDDRLDGFHAALHQQTRNFILWTSAVMASFSTVIVASGVLT
jgi:chaperonin cofactor prefoldin